MLNMIYNTELQYIKCFSAFKEYENTIKFWDDRLPDMYFHNFTLIKDKLDYDKMTKLIADEIESRRLSGKDFLRIETNFDIGHDIIAALPVEPEISYYDYMSIATDRYSGIKGNEAAVILQALEDKVLKDGISVDIKAGTPAMGAFAERRSARKAEAYVSADRKPAFYVCYLNDMPIGKCELLVNGSAAKIEDFDILEEFQRKGFGTSVIKHLLEQAIMQGAQTAYLITESDDTAKDMYLKCGFVKVGQKTELFFKL